MYAVDLFEGRVFTVRLGLLASLEEAKQLRADIGATLSGATGRLVAIGDFRQAAIHRQEITDVILGVLRSDNVLLERSAHIIGPSVILAMQIERLAREAGNPDRKVFRNAEEGLAFVREKLTIGQRTWLHGWMKQEFAPAGPG